MKLDSINTERLILKPISLEILQSVIKGKYEILEKQGITKSSNWPSKYTLGILPIVEKQIEEANGATGFEVWLIIDKEHMNIIGDAGFKGQPNDEGEVEIGYGLVQEERRKGYGYEAVKELVSWAFSQEKVKKVMADCLKDNSGSIRILEKVGMTETKRDDEYIYWEKVNSK